MNLPDNLSVDQVYTHFRGALLQSVEHLPEKEIFHKVASVPPEIILPPSFRKGVSGESGFLFAVKSTVGQAVAFSVSMDSHAILSVVFSGSINKTLVQVDWNVYDAGTQWQIQSESLLLSHLYTDPEGEIISISPRFKFDKDPAFLLTAAGYLSWYSDEKKVDGKFPALVVQGTNFLPSIPYTEGIEEKLQTYSREQYLHDLVASGRTPLPLRGFPPIPSPDNRFTVA